VRSLLQVKRLLVFPFRHCLFLFVWDLVL